MRGGLIGDDVDRDPAAEQLGKDLGGVADHADRPGAALGLGPQRLLDGVVEVVGDLVQVAMLDPAVQPGPVDVDDQAGAAVQGDGQRLGAAHPAATPGQGQGAGQGAVEPLVGDGGEGLVRALDDALGADVDPRPGGHLPVHGQPQLLQPAELGPGGPVPDQVGVGHDHPRRPLVGAHHPDRPAGLDQHGLVGLQVGQRADHGVEGGPVAGGAAGAAVDDQVVGAFGVLRVQVVHQHPHRGLGRPRLGGEGGAAGRADRTCSLHGDSPSCRGSAEGTGHRLGGGWTLAAVDQGHHGVDLRGQPAVRAGAGDARRRAGRR